MGITIDKGFSHALATEILKDSPDNQAAKDILSKPKYRVNNEYFHTEKEAMKYLEKKYPELLKGPNNIGFSIRNIKK